MTGVSLSSCFASLLVSSGFALGTSGDTGRLFRSNSGSRELLMSSTDGETGMRNLADKATQERLQEKPQERIQYERLEKDVAAVKNDIAALTDQITDALNSFAGTAQKQARHGYKQARANVDSAVDDLSERGGAMMDAAQDAASSIEETLEDVITQRPLATVGLALGIGFLIGATWRR
jgi:ElaB/YqjD/DUF883 family membrane-anchored ribosome-binding protein